MNKYFKQTSRTCNVQNFKTYIHTTTAKVDLQHLHKALIRIYFSAKHAKYLKLISACEFFKNRTKIYKLLLPSAEIWRDPE